jgi:DNA-3-methyladenine glycosylase I
VDQSWTLEFPMIVVHRSFKGCTFSIEIILDDKRRRCSWTRQNPLMIEYHDKEWGVPVHDDRKLFEFLILEGAQAGLTWQTVLNKRENYRKAFDGFEVVKIARYGTKDVERLLANSGIIRNRLKIAASIQNAKAFLEIKKEFGTFDAYVWQFVGCRPINHMITSIKAIPASTKESDVMSKDLFKRGFKFVGSTICYAFMQAIGMVNDHEIKCFRYREC